MILRLLTLSLLKKILNMGATQCEVVSTLALQWEDHEFKARKWWVDHKLDGLSWHCSHWIKGVNVGVNDWLLSLYLTLWWTGELSRCWSQHWTFSKCIFIGSHSYILYRRRDSGRETTGATWSSQHLQVIIYSLIHKDAVWEQRYGLLLRLLLLLLLCADVSFLVFSLDISPAETCPFHSALQIEYIFVICINFLDEKTGSSCGYVSHKCQLCSPRTCSQGLDFIF